MYHERIGELLDSCISFENRLVVLEDYTHLNFKELHAKVAKLDNNTSFVVQSESARTDGRVATLLETVKKFNEVREKESEKLEKEIKLLKGRVELMSASSSSSVPPTATAGQTPTLLSIPPTQQPRPTHFPNRLSSVNPYFMPAVPPVIPNQPYPAQQASFIPALQNHLYVPPSVPVVPTPSLPNQLMRPKSGTPPAVEGKPSIILEVQYIKLVGREGRTINQIRQRSGATITIKEKTDKPPVKYYEVHYLGSAEQVKTAIELVNEVLSGEADNAILDVASSSSDDESPGKRGFLFGVRVECDNPALKHCRCRIHDPEYCIKVLNDLRTSDLGKLIIENLETSLDLPPDSFTDAKGIILKTSFICCKFRIELNVHQVARLQQKYRSLCSELFSSESNSLNPLLKEPTPITGHKLYLTHIQSFDKKNRKESKKIQISKSSLKAHAPLFILPYC